MISYKKLRTNAISCESSCPFAEGFLFKYEAVFAQYLESSNKVLSWGYFADASEIFDGMGASIFGAMVKDDCVGSRLFFFDAFAHPQEYSHLEMLCECIEEARGLLDRQISYQISAISNLEKPPSEWQSNIYDDRGCFDLDDIGKRYGSCEFGDYLGVLHLPVNMPVVYKYKKETTGVL